MASARKAREEKAAKIRHLLETEGGAVAENTRGFNDGRYETTARMDDYEALKDQAREIKEDAIERLPDLIDQVAEHVEANGGTVYLAQDAEDANRYIRSVCDEQDAERVIKSKSMTSEEIEVNDALGDAGVEVVETDLGEWVLQVADEHPSHIVAPAIHKSRDAIADLFNDRFDPDEPLETAAELTAFAREKLLEQIKGADVGMTGANFIAADSGTMMLVTSEGNARKTVVTPDTHVAVAGVEKIVPSVEDFHPFVELIAKSGTGEDITSYISLFTPPVESPTVDFDDPDVPMADGDDDRSFHLVLIDNGRLAMREDEHLKETLYCIRCSACSNTCANFQSVGGHAFGGETYSGGIATGWEAGVHGQEVAAEFNDLCTGCSRCVEACPVKIDIPWINTVVRDRANRDDELPADWLVEGLVPDEEPGGPGLQKRFFGNYSTVAKLGSLFAPLSNWAASLPPTRIAIEWLLGVDRRRELPSFSRESLVAWFDRRGGSAVPASDARREVVLYPDAYANYIWTERGKAAVRALEALDVHVRVPDVGSSGRAPLSQGMIATAERHAHEVYAGLAEHIDAGRDVVVIEPSDVAMFRDDYERFLAPKAFERLSENTFEVMEYVYGLVENGADLDALRHADDAENPRVAYHSHCQQRTQDFESYTTTLLDDLGYDVLTSRTECCGMAGSFGYKEQYYELSIDVGSRLRDQFDAEGERDRAVLASGTSCLDQLESLLPRPSRHPIQHVAPPGDS